MKHEQASKILIDGVIKLVPKVFAAVVFLVGCLFLYSLFRPISTSDIRIIRDILPLELVEFSHIGASIVAVLMILIARGLWERIDSAYYMAIALFVFGAVFASTRSLDIPASAIMLVCAILIVPCKPAFNRRSNLFELGFSPFWLIGTLLALATLVWIGFYFHERVPYSNGLWAKFEYSSNTSRFLRGLLIALTTFKIVALWRLFGIARFKPNLPDKNDLDRLKEIIPTSEQNSAWLALLADKSILWHESKQAFLMYGISGNNWIVMGDPIGTEQEVRELCWQLKELAENSRAKISFYCVSKANLPLMIDLGLALYKIGEEAMIDCQKFSLEGKAGYGFRQTIRKFDAINAMFEIIEPDAFESEKLRLREVSDAWLKEKKISEKSFSLGFYDEKYLSASPIAAIRIDGTIMAFANLLPSANKFCIAIDLMRYDPKSPPNIIEFLFLKLIEYCRQEGYKFFSLGLSPLSGLEQKTLAPAWSKIGSLIYVLGGNFYNFAGLRAFKQKFHPDWEPRYYAVTGREANLASALLSLVKLGNGP